MLITTTTKLRNAGDSVKRRRIYALDITLSYDYSQIENDELHETTLKNIENLLGHYKINITNFCQELFAQWQGEMLKLSDEEKEKNKTRITKEYYRTGKINQLNSEEIAIEEYMQAQTLLKKDLRNVSIKCIKAFTFEAHNSKKSAICLQLQLQLLEKPNSIFNTLSTTTLNEILSRLERNLAIEISFFSALNLRYLLRKLLTLKLSTHLDLVKKIEKIRRSLIYNYYSNSYKQAYQYNKVATQISNTLADSNSGTHIRLTELIREKKETIIVFFLNTRLHEIKK